MWDKLGTPDLKGFSFLSDHPIFGDLEVQLDEVRMKSSFRSTFGGQMKHFRWSTFGWLDENRIKKKSPDTC